MRKLASTIFLLTAALITLGALGHDSNAAKLSAEFAKYPSLDTSVVAVVLAVWHFCSGCMVVIGVICLWTWWRARRGERDVFFATDAIGTFYAISGVASVFYTGKPFFWVFVLLGGLLLLSSLPLRRAPPADASTPA
jgi:hypothetical protein